MVSKLKRLPIEWEENLCQIYIRQGTDNQNMHRAQNVNVQKINDPMKKWTNELNRSFSKEEIQMAKKQRKNCPPSLTTKKFQIKTILRFHLIPIKIGIEPKQQMLARM
jgi:hypothetical protein